MTGSCRATRRSSAHIAPLVVLVLALLAGAVGGPVERAVADAPQCSDKIDNDGDGKIDFKEGSDGDPGCRNARDDDETDPQCLDGKDNDGDGKIDFRKLVGRGDPGCESRHDNDETDPVVPAKPQCSDGIDNDGDLKVDVGVDPGCSSSDDNDEADPVTPTPDPATPAPYCSDRIDNDGDRKVDFGADPGCSSTGDNDETDLPPPPPPPAPPAPQCSDGRDNDGDLRVDLGADPGCSSTGDNDETDPAVVVVSSSAASPRLLSPFPVVRLRGQILKGRVRISLLTVRAPIGSRITITCSVRRACPRRTSKRVTTTRTVRFRAFERRQLRVGTILRIYVTKPGFVGKYTRFKIRRRGAPLRSDTCARPNNTVVRCP